MEGITRLEQYVQSGKYVEFDNHQHYECEVHYIVQGEMGVYVNNVLISMETGSLLFINSHVRHKIVPLSDGDYECFTFLFNHKTALKSKNIVPDFDFTLLFDRQYLYVKPEWIDQEFLQGMNKVLLTSYYWNMEGVFYHKFLEYIMYLNMKTGFDTKGQFRNHSGKLHSYEVLTDYIEQQNYCVTLEELSAKSYLNRYYICHLFKEVSGMTVMDYINKHKVIKAQEMLKYTDLSITEIGGKCGYDTSSKFNRAFKKHVGVSPSEYRKKNKLA